MRYSNNSIDDYSYFKSEDNSTTLNHSISAELMNTDSNRESQNSYINNIGYNSSIEATSNSLDVTLSYFRDQDYLSSRGNFRDTYIPIIDEYSEPTWGGIILAGLIGGVGGIAFAAWQMVLPEYYPVFFGIGALTGVGFVFFIDLL